MRCFEFVVVQAVMRVLGNAGRAELVFKATAFRLSAFKVFGGGFGLHRRGFGLFVNLGMQNARRFIGRAVCVAGVMLRGTD